MLNIILIGIANSVNILVDLDDVQQRDLNRLLLSSPRVSCILKQHNKNLNLQVRFTQIKHKIYFDII